MQAIALIYGEQVIDDLNFYAENEDVLQRYAHGIMTLLGTPAETLRKIADDPVSIPGWAPSLRAHPQDVPLLQEFLDRLISYRQSVSR